MAGTDPARIEDVDALAYATGTEFKALRTLLNGNLVDLGGLTTTAKTSLVAAINEVAGAVAGASGIDDTTTTTASTWSSSKITTAIGAALDGLVNGAPGALDTLAELAAAIGNDDDFAATITSGLANRVRFDAAQSLSDAQKAQARANIGATVAVEHDFVATFEDALS